MNPAEFAMLGVKIVIKLRRLLGAYVIVEDAHKHLGFVMRMAKTDQAAQMCSSCCRNTSAQLYQGTHVYARINECCWTMRSPNGEYTDRLLENHMVISQQIKVVISGKYKNLNKITKI